ncbi:TPR-like protein [Marasmius fiardii PR-910]|nr:TPR-like protein [Marasmius fiardii PR-910]
MALAALKKKLELWEEAVTAFKSEDYEGSLLIFEAIEPSSQIAMNIGFIYSIRGDHEKAMKQYTKAIALDSYLALAYFQRGISYSKIGKLDEAEADFCTAEVMMKGEVIRLYNESGLDFALRSPEILFNKALVVVKSGREQEAMAILRKADTLRSTLEHQVIQDAMGNVHQDYPYFCVVSDEAILLLAL